MTDDDIWFEPKRFGYGAGLPVAWQGWALLGGYAAVVLGLVALWRGAHPAAFVGAVVLVTLAMMAIAAKHTRGGWRWRWGGEDRA